MPFDSAIFTNKGYMDDKKETYVRVGSLTIQTTLNAQYFEFWMELIFSAAAHKMYAIYNPIIKNFMQTRFYHVEPGACTM